MSQAMNQDLKVNDWKEISIVGEGPSARRGHACALMGSRVYLFGGTSGSSYCNDLYSLDLSCDKLKWCVVEQSGEAPSPRERPTLSVIDDELFVFGGQDKESSFKCAEGVYVFKTSSGTWEHCETTGPAPQALSLSASVHGNQLVMFGGVLNGEAQQDVYILDTITMTWSAPVVIGTPPPVRCDHSAIVVGNKLFITCGSGSNTLLYSDLYTLDLVSLEWNCVDVKGKPPVPRECASLSVLLGQYLIVFGGFNGVEDEQCFNDLYIVDLLRNVLQWEAISMNQLPPARSSHSAVTYEKKIFVFAGEDLERDLSDAWCSEVQVPMTGFEPVPIPRVRYTPSVPIPSPRKVVTPAPPNPSKPRDFEELRSTYMKQINEMFDCLSEKFQQLDSAVATLESERSAFESEKKAHTELYERQQADLKEMLDSHRIQNEEWLEKIRQETESERRELARQKAVVDKDCAALAREQEEFSQKSKKLDAIMKQMQGLTS